jgi:hypothetical protein
LKQCRLYACSARGAIIENASLEDIRGGGMSVCFLWGCAYENVVLRGWIGALVHRWIFDPDDERSNAEWLQENRKRYERIPLALDMESAKFTFTQDFLGVPSRSIRRNPEWHYILSAAGARDLLQMKDAYIGWKSTAQDLLKLKLPDVVVAVGCGSKTSGREKAIADRLRREGVLL